VHAELVYGLKIKRTNLRDSRDERFPFKGLFAARPFKKGDRLVPYVCSQDAMPDETFAVNGVDPYIYMDHFSALQYRSIGAHANSVYEHRIRETRDAPGCPYLVLDTDPNKYNAVFKDRILVAMRDIERDEEILLMYTSGDSQMRPRREYIQYSIHDVSCNKVVSRNYTRRRTRTDHTQSNKRRRYQ